MEVNNNMSAPQMPQQNVNTGVASTPKMEAPKMEAPEELKAQDVEKVPEENTKISSKEEVEELVDKLNKAIAPLDTSLKFGFDSSSDDFYVSVVNEKTSETIRRFPAEEASTLAEKMYEITGALFDQKG
ncbi:MAG: flagellar biosynthesis protein FlaG [Helicobacteraceae bacterium]|nr:flagellar biosynthesis protein FlaG [Helicobacteraceae bacterium]